LIKHITIESFERWYRLQTSWNDLQRKSLRSNLQKKNKISDKNSKSLCDTSSWEILPFSIASFV